MGSSICKEKENEERKPSSKTERGASLQRNLVREQNRDFHDVYHVVGTIGEGSISNIYKVMKRENVIGSSSFSTDSGKRRSSSLFRRNAERRRSRGAKRRKTTTGQVYALKEIDITYVREGFVDELRNEVEILRSLDHPNILKLYETYLYRRKLSIVIELCTGGDLHKRNPYTEAQAATITKQLLLAINYMHKHYVIHRDIKHENVMHANEDLSTISIKVIDFGLSRVYHKSRLLTARVGTLYTMAPETIEGVYSTKADLWSVGVVVYMLLSGGSRPFWGKSRNLVTKQVLRGKYDMEGEIWNERSEQGRAFVRALLTLDPKRRLDAEAALRHPWLSKETKLSHRVPDLRSMEATQASLVQYAESGEFRRIVMNMIAKKVSTEEILNLRETFYEFDINGDGTISLNEFKKALSHSNLPDSEIQSIFRKLDVNKQQYIIYTEFIAGLLELRGHLDEASLMDAFEQLDLDDTHYISEANLRKILGKTGSKEYVRRLIMEADFDNDGKISFEEFKRYLNERNDEYIRQSLQTIAKVEQDC